MVRGLSPTMVCLMRSTTEGTMSAWAVIARPLVGEPTADGLIEVERAAGDLVAGAADTDGLAVARASVRPRQRPPMRPAQPATDCQIDFGLYKKRPLRCSPNADNFFSFDEVRRMPHERKPLRLAPSR